MEILFESLVQFEELHLTAEIRLSVTFEFVLEENEALSVI